MDRRDLETRFTYHSPTAEQTYRYSRIRAEALAFALLLNEFVPEGREKSTAITKLEEVVMFANAGIARGESGFKTPNYATPGTSPIARVPCDCGRAEGEPHRPMCAVSRAAQKVQGINPRNENGERDDR